MNGKRRPWLRRGDFVALRGEVNKENREALRMFAIAWIPLGIINFTAQLVIVGGGRIYYLGLLTVLYSTLLLALEHWCVPEEYPHSTAALYLAQVPVYLLATLLGTVWDPGHQAITILMCLVIMPVFIMDRPIRIALWQGAWALLFVILCRTCKEPVLFHSDLVHAAEFYIASLVVMALVIHVRLSFLENMEEKQYVLRHDARTGCLSRYALEEQTGRLIGRPLVLVLAELDNLRLYRDFYGHNAADSMMLYFTRSFADSFGEEAAFRYGGNELVCIFTGDTAQCFEKLEDCRRALQRFSYEGKKVPLTCSVGYVSGSAQNAGEFRSMIRLADIYAGKARQRGGDRTEGGAFSAESLRQGILDSNLYTHAKAYEINQLTGLPDLSYFIARADEMLGTVADKEREPVLGYFKLIDLRGINNRFGYAQGDELIADTARLLRESFAGRHVCYVTSGEFCVLCYRDEAEQAFIRLREALLAYKPGLAVQSKIGLARWHEGQRTISLVDEAKLALNSILSSERTVCYYDSALDEEIRFRQYINSHVDEAVEKGWLQVWYQPIARAVTGHVCNEEALSRWDDPAYGFLMPFRFIPVLEDSGLMYKVNLNVVRTVLRDFNRKKELGVPVVPVSVNLSRRDFESCDMVREITDLVDAAGFPRSMLKIEITESAFVSDQELLRHQVERFHENGFEVWLDDFGSEYSTLNLLQNLNFDLIKLDMQFMRNFSSGGKNQIIVSKVLEMAHQLGIDTLIEGVETIEHFNIMKKLGCDKIQGYLFNKPNPIDYIIGRALSSTGLTFESEEATPYYEAVSREDLNEPMRALGNNLRVQSELPTGVIELRDESFHFLRGNETFLQKLEGLGVIKRQMQGFRLNMPIDPTPPGLYEAAVRCLDNDEWVSFGAIGPVGEKDIVYLRRITDYRYRGGLALLTVVLPDREG